IGAFLDQARLDRPLHKSADAGHAEVERCARFAQQHAVAPPQYEEQPGLCRRDALRRLARHKALHAPLRHLAQKDQPVVQITLNPELLRMRTITSSAGNCHARMREPVPSQSNVQASNICNSNATTSPRM